MQQSVREMFVAMYDFAIRLMVRQVRVKLMMARWMDGIVSIWWSLTSARVGVRSKQMRRMTASGSVVSDIRDMIVMVECSIGTGVLTEMMAKDVMLV